MNLALRMALGFAGVDDAEAKTIDDAIPAAERLDDAAAELEPIVERIWRRSYTSHTYPIEVA